MMFLIQFKTAFSSTYSCLQHQSKGHSHKVAVKWFTLVCGVTTYMWYIYPCCVGLTHDCNFFSFLFCTGTLACDFFCKIKYNTAITRTQEVIFLKRICEILQLDNHLQLLHSQNTCTLWSCIISPHSSMHVWFHWKPFSCLFLMHK